MVMALVELNYGRDIGFVDEDGQVYRIPRECMATEEFQQLMAKKRKTAKPPRKPKPQINSKKGY